jgi:hypothetical protein
MEEKACAHYDVHFQKELDSLKVNMTCIASLLKKTPRNTSGKGMSNRPATFA